MTNAIVSISHWKTHIAKLETIEDFNQARAFIRKGEVETLGLHPFRERGEVGLALWLLDQRATQKGLSRYSKTGTYYKVGSAGYVQPETK